MYKYFLSILLILLLVGCSSEINKEYLIEQDLNRIKVLARHTCATLLKNTGQLTTQSIKDEELNIVVTTFKCNNKYIGAASYTFYPETIIRHLILEGYNSETIDLLTGEKR